MSSNARAHQPYPWDTWEALSTIDLRLLEQLAYLARMRGRDSPSGAKWCRPGRAWLAQRLKVSIVTISRHVSKLHALGILDRFQPRPKQGHYQTNVYRLRSWSAWRAGQLRALIERASSRVSLKIHRAASSEATRDPKYDAVAFGTLYDRWLKRGEASTPPTGGS